MKEVPDAWTGGIDELVTEANARLLDILPDDRAARPKDEVNARLVRHYTTQGLLPTPWREGREARYGALHLLHLLALRRLMADGLSGKALYAALDGKTPEQLTELISVGADMNWAASSQFEVVEEELQDSNPALLYLQKLKRKAEPPTQTTGLMRERAVPRTVGAVPEPPAPAAAPSKPLPDFLLPGKLRQQRTLRHVEVQPGLEVQVASDFDWPEDEQHWQELMDELRAVLHEIEREI